MAKRTGRRGAKAASRAKRAQPVNPARVPGPTENPATNLMLADVAIRAGSYIVRRAVERGFLRGRYGKETAKAIIENRTPGKTLVSFGLASLATRSLPGAVIVGGGAIAKALYDRRKGKRRQRIEGDRTLIEQARSDD